MKLQPFLIAGFALLLGCSTRETTDRNVSTVMDEVITRLYAEVPSTQYDAIDDEFILDFLTPEEKQVLATRYQYFTVNVPVIISLMRDRDQKTLPFWLGPAGFVKTGEFVKSESYTYEVWQKEFDAGRVELGINGFDKHRPVYFVSVAPKNSGDELIITDPYPSEYNIATLEENGFTYHDWSDLLIVEVPESLRGQKMFTTVRGRAREAHIKEGFRITPYPSSSKPDQVMLTWSDSPETTMDIQWRTDTATVDGVAKVWIADTTPTDTMIVQASRYRMQDRMLVNDRYIHRFTANVKGLTPGTRYSYRVGSVSTNQWSEVKSFKTGDGSSKFSFVWFGDTHCFPDTGRIVTLASKHTDIGFYTIAGDIVNTGLNRDDWDRFFAHSQNAFATKPLMPVPGNHDRQDGLGAKMYYDLFSLPQNGPAGVDKESTYAFEYGNALFLMIDGTSDWDAHTPWIEEQLRNTSARWKFAIFHFPPYNFEDPYPDLQEKWIPLFDRYHVDMVFGGHIHYYMRSKPMKAGKVVDRYEDGTVYAISISRPSRHNQIADEPYAVVQYKEDYFYQLMEIDGDVLKYSSYDQSDKLRDQFSITK